VAVHADNIYGEDVRRYLSWLDCPKALVVLRPAPSVVAQRERERGTTAYRNWIRPGDWLEEAAAQFENWLCETPRIGLWVDSSLQTPAETVEEILHRWDEAVLTA
jgi:hypothetical protein